MSKVDFKECNFQISCPNCYESIYVLQETVAVGVSGKPIQAELKRMFKKPELNADKCPCCGQTELVKDFSYEPEEVLVNDDLPF